MGEKYLLTEEINGYTNGILFGTKKFIEHIGYGNLNYKDYLIKGGFIKDSAITLGDSRIYLLKSKKIESRIAFHKNLDDFIVKTFFEPKSRKGKINCYIDSGKIEGFSK